MVKANGLVILTEEEDNARIKKIIQATIQEYNGTTKEESDEIIGIDEVRILFGAKRVGDNVVGSPTRRTINSWMNRKEKPLPCISKNPSKFLAKSAFDWFVNNKDTYQH